MSDGIQIKTLEELLAEQGLDMSALTDPGARFGTQYGQEGAYGFAFTPFDIGSYQESAEALKGLEQSLMGGIEEQFGFERRGMQTGLSSELQKIQEMGRPSGLVGGATGRLMDVARRGAQESYGRLVGQTEQRRTSTQEQLGAKAAQLEGLFSSFLEGGTSRYLQLLQADPTGGAESRIATQADVQAFLNQMGGLNLVEKSNFMAGLLSLIGKPYSEMQERFLQLRQDYMNG
jgi:hypothetical protein